MVDEGLWSLLEEIRSLQSAAVFSVKVTLCTPKHPPQAASEKRMKASWNKSHTKYKDFKKGKVQYKVC